jgi:hypothetical protein
MFDSHRIILTDFDIQSLVAGFQRVGRAAQQAADNMVEAFAAAAQRLELERWQRAEARREAQWHRQQEKNILRQQLDRDTTYFGRKRRARRARGRRIEAKRAFLESIAQRLEPLARRLLRPGTSVMAESPPVIVPCDQIKFTCHVVPREQPQMITLERGQVVDYLVPGKQADG